MGPAAIKGPTPGIASAPIPASTPKVPPITPPVVTPAVVPSGALVSLTCANSFVLLVSGSRTEMSPTRKACRDQGVNRSFSMVTRTIDSKDRSVFTSHVCSSPDMKKYVTDRPHREDE